MSRPEHSEHLNEEGVARALEARASARAAVGEDGIRVLVGAYLSPFSHVEQIKPAPSWTIEVWACPWVLTSQHFGFHKRCGYIGNGPGVCPYDHPVDDGVPLVKIATLEPDWDEYQ